jgi:hypothetical protein
MKSVICLLAATSALAIPAAAYAQQAGVTEVAPGVREIDGAKVAALSISGTSVKAAVAADPKFSAIKKQLGGDGIASPGPSGTITHMYKLRDTDDGKDKVLILFVKGGKVLDLLLT